MLGGGMGVVDKFLIPAFRKAYTDNYFFKKLIDNLDKRTFKVFLNIFKKNLSKKDFYIIKSFIKKYITIETFAFFQNVLQVPKQIGSQISFKFVKDTLKRCKIKKTSPLKFDRTDYRKFLQPFYSSNDKISKIFYNTHLHVLCKKIK
jgi:predicted DNA-binding protein